MINFNDITLKSKSVSQKQRKGYNIYKNRTEFVFVEAITAAEAIEKSGVSQIFKVEPANITRKSVFLDTELSENN